MHVRAFASKSPEQAARIAGVLALWQDLKALAVGVEQMADAIELAQFYLGEAKRLSEAATITAEVESAERLRVWLLENWPSIAQTHNRDPRNVVPHDVVLWGPGSMRETAGLKKTYGNPRIAGWFNSTQVR